MNSVQRDAIASLPCVRSRAARNAGRRDAIGSLAVTVRRAAMDDAWRVLWDGGAGQPYSGWYSRAQPQTTTEIRLPLQFCSFIIAHGSSPLLPETVCAEPIVCRGMIGDVCLNYVSISAKRKG